MAQGKTHDAITLWLLPAVTGGSWWLSGESQVALILGGSFLFSGLMFSGDLDIHSHQYRRWGWLRWLWLPYRRVFNHRSFWTHGPVVGTLVRILYVGAWVGLGFLLWWGLHRVLPVPAPPWIQAQQSLVVTPALLWCVLGLELGSLSHSLADVMATVHRKYLKF
jgi:uncharacterized metal-binding protein